MTTRVRFAPSPTGNVHIGNIRVAIFNWLFARNCGGKFLLRIEDTDRERSTPEAIRNLLNAMEWLGLDYDEEAIYQTAMAGKHIDAANSLVEAGHASKADDGPTLLHLSEKLFDDSFITEAREEASISVAKGELFATRRCFMHKTISSKGQVFTTPINWDALTNLSIELEDGSRTDGAEIYSKVLASCGDDAAKEILLDDILGNKAVKLHFKRRFVFFDDMVGGRMEKPLDSLRDLVIVRSDGSPVFHLANVIDDNAMGITHILRGNDHVENTYRHLFIFKALGMTPPKYAHFPMIVNAKGKPYSKRDGDAYVGDFQNKGFLPECLFNFLALCGWAPGDDREIMTKEDMVSLFSLDRINASAAQFNIEKLEWMNSQYLLEKPEDELLPLVRKEVEKAGFSLDGWDGSRFSRLLEIQRQRMKTLTDFVDRSAFFFADDIEFDEKAVKKALSKKEWAGLKVVAQLKDVIAGVEDWTEEGLAAAIDPFAENNGLKMGDVAQPLRVAVTGNTVSPGIHETLFLLGKETTLARMDKLLGAYGENI